MNSAVAWALVFALQQSTSPAPKQAATPADAPAQINHPLERPAPQQPSLLTGTDTRWRSDHLRVLPPTSQGTGFWITGVAAVGAIFIKQLAFVLECADPGCNTGRLSDRILWLGATAALTYASSMRAHHVAFYDALQQRLVPRSRRREIWGTVLVSVGAAVFATDVGLQSACMLGKGPYFIDRDTIDPNSNYFYGCKGWLGTGLMNLGGAALVTGASLLAWERSYQRDRNIYRRGKLRITPTLGGLSARGRF